MTSRRRFLRALAAGLLASRPGFAAGFPVRSSRVGFLASRRRPEALASDFYGEFAQGLRDLGWVEGENLVLLWRFADGEYARLPALARELVGLKVDVLVTDGTTPTLAAQEATKTTPIVFATSADPVGQGLVKSLARPGGNTTGISLISREIAGKQLEMLRSVVPGLSRVGAIVNPGNSATVRSVAALQVAGRSVAIEVVPLDVRNPREIESAFSAMTGGKIGAFLVQRDPFLTQERVRIVEMASLNRIPGMGGIREFADAGRLMSYGVHPALQFPPEMLLLADKVID